MITTGKKTRRCISSTGTYETELKRLCRAFDESDIVIVVSGSGLLASAGYGFVGERLKKHFGDFVYAKRVQSISQVSAPAARSTS